MSIIGIDIGEQNVLLKADEDGTLISEPIMFSTGNVALFEIYWLLHDWNGEDPILGFLENSWIGIVLSPPVWLGQVEIVHDDVRFGGRGYLMNGADLRLG